MLTVNPDRAGALPHVEGARRAMPRFLLAAVTAVVAAALAVGAAIGIVAILNMPPDQPNVPLVTFPTAEAEPKGDGAERRPEAGRTAGADGEPEAGRTAGTDRDPKAGDGTGTDGTAGADDGAAGDEAGRQTAGAASGER